MVKKCILGAMFATFGVASGFGQWFWEYPELSQMNKEGLVDALKNESSKSILYRNFTKIGAIKQELATGFGVRFDNRLTLEQRAMLGNNVFMGHGSFRDKSVSTECGVKEPSCVNSSNLRYIDLPSRIALQTANTKEQIKRNDFEEQAAELERQKVWFEEKRNDALEEAVNLSNGFSQAISQLKIASDDPTAREITPDELTSIAEQIRKTNEKLRAMRLEG